MKGEVVHMQTRDPRTGLYPLTLNLNGVCNSELPLDLEGEAGAREVRSFLTHLVPWAEGIVREERNQGGGATKCASTHVIPQKKLEFFQDLYLKSFLAKFYIREGINNYRRWHDKLGHIGGKAIRKCGIRDLSIPRSPFRCEACIRGKMHKLGQSQASTGVWSDYKPGEYLITDLQGPYTRSLQDTDTVNFFRCRVQKDLDG